MPQDPPDHALAAQQAKFNRSTAAHWSHFAPHRAEIERLLLPDLPGPRGRLCVLGAGNCNDLDLRTLTEQFDAVHLVDLDPAALAGAAARQGVERSPRLHLHGGTDLTGVAPALASWAKHRPSHAEVDAATQAARDATIATPPGPFDVVLSPCLLSQLTGYANDLLGPAHPRLHDLRAAIRDRHLRLMVDLLAPGGAALLVCDLASSGTVGGLRSARRDDLPSLVNKLVNQGGHFIGLSPAAITRILGTDPALAPLVAETRLLRPWIWTLGPLKTFLVYGVRFRRSRKTVLLDVPPRSGRFPGP